MFDLRWPDRAMAFPGRLLATLVATLAAATLAASPATAGKRVALVIGNARYDAAPAARTSTRDAAAIADRLRELGFAITELFDGDALTLNRSAEQFIQSTGGAELALIYFAGHGIALRERNFLLASDADPAHTATPEDLGLDLTKLVEGLRRSRAVRHAL